MAAFFATTLGLAVVFTGGAVFGHFVPKLAVWVLGKLHAVDPQLPK